MVDRVSGSVASAGYSAERLGRIEVAPSRLRQADQLTPEEQRQVDELKRIDAKVHRHEEAHLAVGRDLVIGGPSYTYTTGPDKKRYAVSGEVSIDTSPARTAEETIPKARHIRATALAPAEPSAQDRSVASIAERMEAKARIEVQAEQQASSQASSNSSTAQANGSILYRSVQQLATAGGRGGRLDLFA